MTLTLDELSSCSSEGFVICREFFTAAEMAPVQTEMRSGQRQRPYALPGHRALISHPGIMGIMEQLCGPGFLFHHLNSYFQTEGTAGVAWHNDYEQLSLPMPRTHANIIVLIYPDGLNGEVGDLVVVPKTHRHIAEWDAYSFLGTAALPGEIVIDALPPGSIAICHTGLVHCRRPKPGPGPRYFCDTSYVARGPRWPATSQHDWRDQYATCLADEPKAGDSSLG